MITVLRILKGEKQGYKDIKNPSNILPAKGDYLVYEGGSYTVLHLEFDYDTNTVYIVVT